MGRVSGTSSPEAIALLGNNNGLARAVLVRDGPPLRRQLQEHEDVCDPIYDYLIAENPGASCECNREAGTFTCVRPSTCVDEESTGCNGGGEICVVLTYIYGWSIQGSTVVINSIRAVVDYTGGHLRSKEIEIDDIKDQCYAFMTTLDGLRYQCNGCSRGCPLGESNVDCSNIQADSTTRGQCVSFSTTTANLGLLNNRCVEGPIVPNTLPVPEQSAGMTLPVSEAAAATTLTVSAPSASGLWHQNVVLAATAMLTCSLLMII
jgi:hypothetical protein